MSRKIYNCLIFYNSSFCRCFSNLPVHCIHSSTIGRKHNRYLDISKSIHQNIGCALDNDTSCELSELYLTGKGLQSKRPRNVAGVDMLMCGAEPAKILLPSKIFVCINMAIICRDVSHFLSHISPSHPHCVTWPRHTGMRSQYLCCLH